MSTLEENKSSRGFTTCRGCDSTSLQLVLDLGRSPVANSLPSIDSPVNEDRYPLILKICLDCQLGQIAEYESAADIFTEYPYLSSTSAYWLDHAKKFAADALKLHPQISNGYILELASNDGYLLKFFQEQGLKVLGVDPAKNVAAIAQEKGIPTLSDFFGLELATHILASRGFPSLIVANNVAAHVPDMFDFFSGIAKLCGEETLVSIENPSLGYLLEKKYYDTVYHEHFSYLTVDSVSEIAERVGLRVCDVEELTTHGGSLRYWLSKNPRIGTEKSVNELREKERVRGVGDSIKIEEFATGVKDSVSELNLWVDKQAQGSVIGYGAAAKTVTTFFAAGLSEDRFAMIVDANPLKQGCRLPGTEIPINSVQSLAEAENAKVLVFPWNLESEIVETIRNINPNLEIWTHNPMRQI